MTHPNFQTNGASLEDCHTNFFALMDLCGIKWRRLSAENLYCVDPLDDPVLLAFTKCLAADILCVWRRVPHQRTHHDHHRFLDLHAQPLLYKKELWIFWYGNEPDLNNILCSELSEVEQGSWENGLSYECRTLLFKAIHNRIERSLLSRDYVRLGKWFVQPYDAPDKPSKSPHSLAFSFFIHGESTVCAVVDVREPPPIRRLSHQHLTSALGVQSGLQVILGPYGQSGMLTGQTYKDTDLSIQKLLEEWRQFYPVDMKLGMGANRDGSVDGCQLPAFVEVIVGGVKLKYPSCYVLVPDVEETSSSVAIQSTTLLAVPGGQGMVKVSGTTSSAAISSISLTPPTSPCDPGAVPAGTATKSSSGAGTLPYGGHGQGSSTTTMFGSCSPVWDKVSRRIVSHVTQDSTILSAAAKVVLPPTGPEEGGNGNWDFADPIQKATCACSKCKKLRQGANGGKPGVSGGSGSLGNVTGSGGKKSEKSDKQQPRHLRNTTPFHRRSPVVEDAVVFDSDAVSRHTHSGTSFQFKGTCSCPPALSGLPVLRTNILEPPASVGSPMSAVPSPLLASSSHSQPASVSQPDPTMPTLSPHPLASKDNDMATVTAVPSVTEDQPMPESHETLPQNNSCQAPTPQGLIKEESKSTTEQPQVFSPFPSNGNVELPKPAVEGSQWPQGQAPPGQQPSNASQTLRSSQLVQTVQESQPPPLKRPVLPTSSYEGLEDDEPTTESLYDYSSLYAWLQVPIKRLKPDSRLELRLSRNSRSSVGDNLPSPAASFKKEPLTPQMPMDMDMIASPKPADPYEFVDDFPTTVSMAGFKSKNETSKEDEKPARDASATVTASATGTTQPSGSSPAEATPSTATNAAPVAGAAPPKDSKSGVNLDSMGSPLTPKTQSTTQSLLREKDLVVTYEDLDQLFDTSDDDTNDNAFQPPNSPGSLKTSGLLDDGTPGKTKTTSGIGILGPTELSRMFPTPPSLEQASPCGPIGMGELAVMETGDTGFTTSRERSDIYPCYGSPEECSMDWSYVFKPAPVAKFVGSSKYAPLPNLPSQLLPPISLPPQCIYKPSWQYPLPILEKALAPSHVSTLSSVESLDRMHCSVEPSPTTFVSSVEPRMPQSFELQSPASNASSYLNKNLNSMDDCGGSGSGLASQMPEAHSLLVNLVLSDSLLNLFKDHNFNSCTMCVCNMNIKGSDMGLYLPELGSPSDEPLLKCTCGFSAVVNRKYGHQAGLFYEDEVEITGLRNQALDRRKPNLLAVEHTKELVSSASSSLTLKDALDPLPDYLLELLKVQYTTLASSSCNLFYKTTLCYQQLLQQDSPPAYNITPPPPPTSTTPTIASAASIMATISAVAAGCSPSSNNSPPPIPPPPYPKMHNMPTALDASTTSSMIEMIDGCEVSFSALDQGRQAYENSICLKLDENLKHTVLHKWPFLSAKLPSNNQDLVRLLRTLQPLLQEAIHKKQSTQFWEATTTATYTVSGPLTWRQFLKLAGKSTEDQCEPQPIPSLLVGYDKDWLALSPFTIKYWEKLLLEPYSLSRDVAYVVVAPDNDYILGNVKKFFKELSSAYEVCKLGRHSPIAAVLRDGIMRVGKKAAKILADQPVDEWFNLIGESPVALKLKLYAQVCKHHLVPHLKMQPMDSTLLDSSAASSKNAEKVVPAASPMPPPTPENPDKDRVPTPKPAEPSVEGTDISNQGGSKESSLGTGSQGGGLDEQDDESQAPSLVIYMVDPFSYCSDNPDTIRLSTIGLLRCYAQMLRELPENMQNNINLQIIPLESILEQTAEENHCKQTDRLKSLAFSVFAQCRRTLIHQSTVKSLTGFGPAAAAELFLKAKDERNSAPHRMYSPPYILAPMKDKQTQLTESFGDHTEKATVLYCTYCLSEDQRWLLASCTDDRGEILDTCIINVDIPNRHRRKKASARKVGLQKLMDWILGIMSSAVMPWRLVVGRLGRLGHGELQGWSNLLSRKTLMRFSKHLKEMCKQCQYMSVQDTPCILSACLVSLEADSALRVMPDQFSPDEFFGSSCNTCDLSTPQDASCTHILVFPTSATTQSSQATYQQDPNFQEVDILSALDEEGHNMTDISAIFNWADPSVQSPVDSPRRESNSRTGSPDLGISDQQSPFQSGGFSRSVDDFTGDPQEEAPQLLQQPLALGYYVSTAKTGPLPKWFWTPCAHLENVCPAFLKSALHIHSPTVQQSSDDLFQQQTHLHSYHPLDSNLTTDVLRYVLEGYNALSWLSVDPVTHDRRSCLPVHIQVLMQMYYAMATLV